MKKILSVLFFFNICHCSEEVKIIQLKPEEYLIYKELRIQSVKEFPEVFGSTHQEEIDQCAEDWKRRLKLNMLFVQVNKQVVGMIGAKIDSREKLKHSAHIISFYILPEFRGEKIGYTLITTLINKLKREKEITRFTLNVTTTATRAIKLYKSLGFKIAGMVNQDYCVNGKYYDQYIMTLSFIKPSTA